VFNKILVCLDGSKTAEQILPYVEAQATQFVSTVTLLQVVTISGPALAGAGAAPLPGEIIVEQLKVEEEDATKYLNGIAESLEAKGIETEVVVKQGVQIGEEIINYARQNSIDLIAIATHGRTGIGRAVFGSIADHLLHHSSLPMLVIKPE